MFQDAIFIALRYGHLHLGVIWFEQGNSIVWNQILQVRTPLEGLRLAYPQYCKRIEEISIQLEVAVTYEGKSLKEVPESVSYSTEKVSLYQALASEREELITTIRTLPGFAQFLLSMPIEDLHIIAQSGFPLIMINSLPSPM